MKFGLEFCYGYIFIGIPGMTNSLVLGGKENYDFSLAEKIHSSLSHLKPDYLSSPLYQCHEIVEITWFLLWLWMKGWLYQIDAVESLLSPTIMVVDFFMGCIAHTRDPCRRSNVVRYCYQPVLKCF